MPRWAKGDNEHAKYTVSSVIFVAQIVRGPGFTVLRPHQPSSWWQLNFFLFSLLLGGDDSQFDWYFSKGLVQPPTSFFFFTKKVEETVFREIFWAFKEVWVFFKRCVVCTGFSSLQKAFRLKAEWLLLLKRFPALQKRGVSENSGFSPQIIHFNRVFHYFHHPFWGILIFGNTQILLQMLNRQFLFFFASPPRFDGERFFSRKFMISDLFCRIFSLKITWFLGRQPLCPSWMCLSVIRGCIFLWLGVMKLMTLPSTSGSQTLGGF